MVMPKVYKGIKCRFCSESFTKKYIMERHMKKIHFVSELNELPEKHFNSETTGTSSNHFPNPNENYIIPEMTYQHFAVPLGVSFNNQPPSTINFMRQSELTTLNEMENNTASPKTIQSKRPESNRKSCTRKQGPIFEKKIEAVCVVCGKVLRNKASLTVHSRIHTGEKPFKCDTCGKSFTQSSTMKIHSLSHMEGVQIYSTTKISNCNQNVNK